MKLQSGAILKSLLTADKPAFWHCTEGVAQDGVPLFFNNERDGKIVKMVKITHLGSALGAGRWQVKLSAAPHGQEELAATSAVVLHPEMLSPLLGCAVGTGTRRQDLHTALLLQGWGIHPPLVTQSPLWLLRGRYFLWNGIHMLGWPLMKPFL